MTAPCRAPTSHSTKSETSMSAPQASCSQRLAQFTTAGPFFIARACVTAAHAQSSPSAVQIPPNAKYRVTLMRMPRDHARALMGTPEFDKSRDERKKIEMRFAHLKTHHRFERMRLRGISGARDECHLVATARNLKTLAKHSWRPPRTSPAVAPAWYPALQGAGRAPNASSGTTRAVSAD